MEIKTFIFFDTETTGLKRPNITELSMIAYRRRDLIEASNEQPFPRVMTKILLHFNPEMAIEDRAVEITGLSNNLLDDLQTFDDNSAILLNSFLNQLNKPICFVAHNGFRFDFPILKRHLSRTNSSLDDDILCMDTLNFFRCVDKGQSKYSLTEIYKRRLGSLPEKPHNAENDVLDLIKCVVDMKDEFINYTDERIDLIKFNEM